jgi:hypothetical protein
MVQLRNERADDAAPLADVQLPVVVVVELLQQRRGVALQVCIRKANFETGFCT